MADPFTVGNRLTSRLAHAGWVPVPSVLLRHQAALELCDGRRVHLRPNDLVVIIHILDFKWTEEDPFPSIKVLASRMGLSPRAVQTIVTRLVKNGVLERRKEPARRLGHMKNVYGFQPLFDALERQLDADVMARARAFNTYAANLQASDTRVRKTAVDLIGKALRAPLPEREAGRLVALLKCAAGDADASVRQAVANAIALNDNALFCSDYSSILERLARDEVAGVRGRARRAVNLIATRGGDS